MTATYDMSSDRAAQLTELMTAIEWTVRGRDLPGNLAAGRDFHLALLTAGGTQKR
jgi:hypothetical protein